MASKHRDIGLKFRHRSTPNTRRVTKDVGFGGGGGTIYIYTSITFLCLIADCYLVLLGGGSKP